jgi:arylformamidase
MLIDLSHVITEGMTTYPGLPGPELSDQLSRDDSEARFNGIRMLIGKVCMVANTGTYVDVPFHYYEDGSDLAEVGVDRLAELPGLLIDVAANGFSGRSIGPEAFAGVSVAGMAVLIRTGWDVHFGTDAYGVEAPFLNSAGVDFLIRSGAALVGIDSVNIDDIGDIERPAHCGLLAAGIPIVEHLVGLKQLGDLGQFTFTAAPPKFTALGTFPVRAYARSL